MRVTYGTFDFIASDVLRDLSALDGEARGRGMGTAAQM